MRRVLFSIQILGAVLLICAPSFAEDFLSLAKKRSEEKPSERPSTPTQSGDSSVQDLSFQLESNCYSLSFHSVPGEVLSCTEPTSVTYEKRDCPRGKILEAGKGRALTSCTDPRRIDVKFKTAKNAINVTLRVRKERDGRSGAVAVYRVESARIEKPKVAETLPPPELKKPEEPEVAESPLDFKFSGFLWMEFEWSDHFGFENESLSQNALTLFSNLNFELGRDRTKLLSVLDAGEIILGDETSGGAIGARSSDVLRVRNLYLSHAISKEVEVQGGLITSVSDPRSFIFNDHVGTLAATYQADDFNFTAWYGNAIQNRPGEDRARDWYLGLKSDLDFFEGLKISPFALYRSSAGESFATDSSATDSTTGDSNYIWVGSTIAASFLDPLNLEATFIANWNDFSSSSSSFSALSYLGDFKASYLWESAQATFTVEGLVTSGDSGTVSADGSQVVGGRHQFVSPVGASYLLTLATSDGVDDAPGVPKDSIIANLGQEEGLILGVASMNVSITPDMALLTRYGYLSSNAASATGSTFMGHEFDLGATYQLTPSTSAQLDYARLFRGDFFTNHEPADLLALKFKFAF